jgi:hypothetical protein
MGRDRGASGKEEEDIICRENEVDGHETRGKGSVCLQVLAGVNPFTAFPHSQQPQHGSDPLSIRLR